MAKRSSDDQLDLFGTWSPIRHPKVAKSASLDERFWAFHQANPQVYRALHLLALQMADTGRRSYGVGGLFEVLRWHYLLARGPSAQYQLNNSYRAFYARLLMSEDPDKLANFFELRKQTFNAKRKCA